MFDDVGDVDVAAERDIKAVTSVICHMTTIPSPPITSVEPAEPPRKVTSAGVGSVDTNSLFPMFIGFL